MFSCYDSTNMSFSEIDSAIKKLDSNDLATYEKEMARLKKADHDYMESHRQNISYESLLLQLMSTTRELAFTKSLHEQEHNSRKAAEGLLLPSFILLCGFFFPVLVTAFTLSYGHDSLSILLCLAVGLAISLFGILYALLVTNHLHHRFPEFYLLYKASDKGLLVFFTVLPSAVLLIIDLIDHFHA